MDITLVQKNVAAVAAGWCPATSPLEYLNMLNRRQAPTPLSERIKGLPAGLCAAVDRAVAERDRHAVSASSCRSSVSRMIARR